jgi:glycerol-3-phosphate dehydrogenase
MNDTRMCLHLALTATQKGACIASRVSVESLTHDDKTGQLNGAIVQDILTGENFRIRTRAIVNATGAFADSIRKMDHPDAKPCIKGAAGGMCGHSLPTTVLSCDSYHSRKAPFAIFLFIFCFPLQFIIF